jgi:hypothetical protein
MIKEFLKQNSAKILFYLVVGGIICVAVLFGSTKCTFFSPVRIEGQPEECNDWYTSMKYDIKNKSGGTMSALTYPDCQRARALKRKIQVQEHCRKQVFGQEIIDKENYKKYNLYLECIKDFSSQ